MSDKNAMQSSTNPLYQVVTTDEEGGQVRSFAASKWLAEDFCRLLQTQHRKLRLQGRETRALRIEVKHAVL